MALYKTLSHDLLKNEIGEKRKMNQANVEYAIVKSDVLRGRRVPVECTEATQCTLWKLRKARCVIKQAVPP